MESVFEKLGTLKKTVTDLSSNVKDHLKTIDQELNKLSDDKVHLLFYFIFYFVCIFYLSLHFRI